MQKDIIVRTRWASSGDVRVPAASKAEIIGAFFFNTGPCVRLRVSNSSCLLHFPLGL
jgi:hypothetical protein